LSIDKRALAIISIVGSSLDVLGALYLAYDLLGGEHGPLRTVTRAVTYGALFGIGYAAVFGPVFGLACGVTHGVTLGWELAQASRRETDPGFWVEAAMSAIRGVGFALGCAWLFGPAFGAMFGVLSTVGQMVAYRLGIRPTLDYAAAPRPRVTMRLMLASANRAVGYGIGAYVSALVANRRGPALPLALEFGLVIGFVTAVITSLIPVVEYRADHMPQRRMGVLGIGCILIGFTLQSVQYWAALME
jgi:hypothetical protein